MNNYVVSPFSLLVTWQLNTGLNCIYTRASKPNQPQKANDPGSVGALSIQKGSPCSVWLRTEASVAAFLPTRAVNSFHPRKQLGIRFLLLSQVTVWYTGIQWYAKTALHESLFQSLTEEIPFISFKSPYGLLHCIELQQLQEF